MLGCFVIKKRCSPSIIPVSKKSGRAGQNSYDDSFKRPSKKEGSRRARGCYKVANLIDFYKKSAMKRWCKKEECEAAINDTVERSKSGKKSAKLLAGKLQAKRTPT